MKNVLIKAFNNIFPIDPTVFQIIEPENSNHLRFLEDSIIAIPGSPTPYRPIYPVDEKSGQYRGIILEKITNPIQIFQCNSKLYISGSK
jgi:hypothetical protein